MGKVPGNYIEKIFPTGLCCVVLFPFNDLVLLFSVSLLEKVIAMYDYAPNGIPSCLTFAKGSIIEVVEKQADGGWKGIYDETFGAFPSSFVKLHTEA